jgi:hypothetical protein
MRSHEQPTAVALSPAALETLGDSVSVPAYDRQNVTTRIVSCTSASAAPTGYREALCSLHRHGARATLEALAPSINDEHHTRRPHV